MGGALQPKPSLLPSRKKFAVQSIPTGFFLAVVATDIKAACGHPTKPRQAFSHDAKSCLSSFYF